MQQVLDNLKDMPSGTGAKDIDLIFLKGIMESPIVRSLAKVKRKLPISTTLYYCLVKANSNIIERRGISKIMVYIEGLAGLAFSRLVIDQKIEIGAALVLYAGDRKKC